MEILLEYVHMDIFGLVLEYCSPYNLLGMIGFQNKEYERVCMNRYGYILKDGSRSLCEVYTEEEIMLIEDCVSANDQFLIAEIVIHILKGHLSCYYKNTLIECIVRSDNSVMLNFFTPEFFQRNLPMTGFIGWNPSEKMWKSISENFEDQYRKDQKRLTWLSEGDIPIDYEDALSLAKMCTERIHFDRLILYFPMNGISRWLLWSVLRTPYVDLLQVIMNLIAEDQPYIYQDVVFSEEMMRECINKVLLFELLCYYALKTGDIPLMQRIYNRWGDFSPGIADESVSREVYDMVCRISSRMDLKISLGIYSGFTDFLEGIEEINTDLLSLFCTGHVLAFRSILDKKIDKEYALNLCVSFKRKDLLELMDIPQSYDTSRLCPSMRVYMEKRKNYLKF